MKISLEVVVVLFFWNDFFVWWRIVVCYDVVYVYLLWL